MPPSTVSSSATPIITLVSRLQVLRVASPSVAEKRTSSGVRRLSRSSMRCTSGIALVPAPLLDSRCSSPATAVSCAINPSASAQMRIASSMKSVAAEPAEQPDHAVDVVLMVATGHQALARHLVVGRGLFELLARDAVAERHRDRPLVGLPCRAERVCA